MDCGKRGQNENHVYFDFLKFSDSHRLFSKSIRGIFILMLKKTYSQIQCFSVIRLWIDVVIHVDNFVRFFLWSLIFVYRIGGKGIKKTLPDGRVKLFDGIHDSFGQFVYGFLD